MAKFVGTDLWAEFGRLAKNAGGKTAAVAYYSAGSRVHFGKGDTLIVDATEDAIRGGQTSALMLLQAAEHGAEVFSHSSLHAKILLTPEAALVGSANLSASSTRLREAGVVLTQPSEVHAVREYIKQLRSEATKLSTTALRALAALPVEQRTLTPRRRGKPSLFQAIAEDLPTLNDVVFGYYGSASDLSRKDVVRGAEREQLPLPKGWTWFEYESDPGLREKIVAACGNRPVIHWVVKFADDASIHRFGRHEPFARSLLGTVRIRDTLASVFGPKGFVTPFDLAPERDELTRRLNRGLARASRALLRRVNSQLGVIESGDLRSLFALGAPKAAARASGLQ